MITTENHANSGIISHLSRAGLYFIECQWVQSQMIHFIGFQSFPESREDFEKNSKTLPAPLANHRYEYMKKTFGEIKAEFVKTFQPVLSQNALNDLDLVHYLRDMIAHSIIFHDKDYFLYRPSQGHRNAEIERVCEIITPPEGVSKMDLYQMNFSEPEIWDRNFAAIVRLDDEHFHSVAEHLGIPRNLTR